MEKASEYDHSDPGNCTLCGRPMVAFIGQDAEHYGLDVVCGCDNRCTMHRRDPFDAAARRIMHRTQVKSMAPPAA